MEQGEKMEGREKKINKKIRKEESRWEGKQRTGKVDCIGEEK